MNGHTPLDWIRMGNLDEVIARVLKVFSASDTQLPVINYQFLEPFKPQKHSSITSIRFLLVNLSLINFIFRLIRSTRNFGDFSFLISLAAFWPQGFLRLDFPKCIKSWFYGGISTIELTQKKSLKKYYESDSEINWGNFWGHFWEDIFSLRIKSRPDNQDRISTREPSEVKVSF